MTTHADDVSGNHGRSGSGRFIFISNENFVFSKVHIGDHQVTGSQIVEAAGKHPVEDYVVLHHLPAGELETKRPNELAKLDNDDHHFFVIKSAGVDYSFSVDGLAMVWPRPHISADNLVYLARAETDSEVIIHRGDGAADIYEGDDQIALVPTGVERFTTRPARKDITITVDGEPYHPPRRKMTPNEIIRQATGQDPSQIYLVRINRGDERESYQGKGDEVIRLRDGMVFVTISVGPTPVSDPAFEQGAGLMIMGLTALGYQVVPVPDTSDKLVFDYTVQSGPYAGKTFKIGFVVPPDFPLTWPSGIHLSPEVHPLNPGGVHPTGGVHKEHAAPFQTGLGGEWQYWSRPYNHRGRLDEPVRSYMNHVWNLWDSQ
ncbi:hypothetical protein EFR00_00455 [Rhizobium sophoriradicis]|uniref:multiubiquitin domain-containing protein n=1 Tax=Rhizobium sophoriradicis TaxID=1535245 RepID=UPI00098EC450|nr:multiubiquitin domain-containing protein [Rhizobium sophoriradicis]RSC20999.1 hypothetical protein EFR00_00455 [Rhizobium sophoriradicis]